MIKYIFSCVHSTGVTSNDKRTAVETQILLMLSRFSVTFSRLNSKTRSQRKSSRGGQTNTASGTRLNRSGHGLDTPSGNQLPMSRDRI